MKRIIPGLVIIASVIGTSQINAQAYEIKVGIKNCTDSICILTKYVWESPNIVDTAVVDKHGNMTFKGKKPLEKGIYSIYSPKKEALYFDFIVDENQKLSITTDTIDLYDKMKLTGPKENQDFLDFVKFMGAKNLERVNYEKEVKSKKTPDSTKLISEKTMALFKEIKKYQKDYLAKNPTNYLATIIRLQMDNDVPGAPKEIAASDTALWKYQYYKNHFWDNIDFHDPGVLNTNKIFADKVKRYLFSVLLQNPDTLAKEFDKIVLKIGDNKETFKWVVHNTTVNAEQSKVMGMDAFFVYLVNKYYRSGQAYWMDEKNLDKMFKRVDIIQYLLIGSKAKDLPLVDTSAVTPLKKMGIEDAKDSDELTKLYYKNEDAIKKMLVNLYGINNDYTVLLFWDVDCGHCKKEVPVILESYHKLKEEGFSIEVFAVYTQHEGEKWKKFIIDNKLDWINVYDGVHLNNLKEKYDIYSTPVIYILDKQKVIQAKRIGAEQVEEVIKMLDKRSKQ